MAKPFLLRIVDASVSGGKTTLTANGSAQVFLIAAAKARTPPNPSTISRLGFSSGFAVTHSATQGGMYVPSAALVAGEFLLVVLGSGKAPVAQRLTLVDQGGFVRAKAGWKAQPNDPREPDRNRQAASVDIHNLGKGAKSKGVPPTETVITVKLSPRREFIFLSGTEYHLKGTTWRLFSEGRRNILRSRKVIGDGDLVTMLICETRERLTFVKATGNSQWLLIDDFLKSGVKRTTPDHTKEPIQPGQDIDILDFYRCLDAAGTAAAGSVAEASIFSHAFVKGPILHDSNESASARTSTARDPNDVDGRAKDWNGAVTLKPFPGVVKAISSTGFLKLWGCNALAELHAKIVNVQATRGPKFKRDVFFTFTRTSKDPEEIAADEVSESNQERMTILHLLKTDIKEGLTDAYAGRAAAFLKQACFGAPPGTGSSFGTQSGNAVMLIEAGSGPIFTFYNRELGAADATDAEGKYFDFNTLSPRLSAVPTPAWSTERFQIRTFINKDATLSSIVLRVASGAFVVRPFIKNGISVEQQSGLVDPKLSGKLFIAPLTKVNSVGAGRLAPVARLTTNANRDTGFYMQDDGSLFVLTRVVGAATWRIDGFLITNGLPPITNGLIHQVKPAFIW